MKKIAFIGIRGIPVVYSGFESFVEDLTSNMKGFDFYVYCRSRYIGKKKHNNVSLIYTPTVYTYKLETFIHSFLSTIHAVFFLKPHIVFYLSVGNAPFLILPKMFGIKTIINVDGMDWDREKWGIFGKWYLTHCAYLTTILADTIVTDSVYSQEYYKKRFNIETIYIPYMANGYKWNEKKEILEKYNIKIGNYFVWAGRLVPDNHLEVLIHAFISSPSLNRKLVVIGDDNYITQYLINIKKMVKVDKRIVLTGFIPRDEYLTLVKNSYAYVETKQSGGTHPSLLEGLMYAPYVMCNDFDANRKINEVGITYYKNRDINSLKSLLNKTIKNIRTNKLNPSYYKGSIVEDYKRLFT